MHSKQEGDLPTKMPEREAGPASHRMSGYGKELRFYSKGCGKPLYILRSG